MYVSLLLQVLEFYQKELLPMESFEEFCDVAGWQIVLNPCYYHNNVHHCFIELHEHIPAAPTFLSDLLTTVVTKPS